MSNYNCVDVSEWNGSIDWNAAKADGVEYALIRCGFGQDITKQDDKYFEINMKNAIAAGVKIGVYMYSYAKSADAARGEAKHTLRLIEPYRNQLSLPVFYDVEESSIEKYVDETVPAFIEEINKAGYNCGVYATGYWFTHCLQYVAIPYLWVAYWGSDDGQPHTKPEFCDIWQYTSKGSVDGIGNGGVDCDILYNTQMTALIDEPTPTPTPTPTPSKTVIVELPILKRGSTGGEVLTIQALLNGFGFRDQNGAYLAIDGIFGVKTEYAVKSYQRARDLMVDGIVGAETWNRILK